MKTKCIEEAGPAWAKNKNISPADKDELRKDFNEYIKKDGLTQLIKRTLGSAPTIFGGNAISRKTIIKTDLFEASILKEMSYLLISKKQADGDKTEGNYVCLIHPFQLYDLMNDAEWIAMNQYKSEKRIFKNYISSYLDIDVFRSLQIPIITEGTSSEIKVYRAVALEIPSAWTKETEIDIDIYLHMQMLCADCVLFAETSITEFKSNKTDEKE